jgi:hypothetical protein
LDCPSYWKTKQEHGGWGAKNATLAWNQAMDGLRHAFAPKKPDHQIYQEIFSEPQDQASTDVSLNKKRMLFAELDSPLTEKAKLDMVYGLLHKRITQRVTRESVPTLPDLLIRAREVETDLRDYAQANRRPHTDEGERRDFCGFCHKKGHHRSACHPLRPVPLQQNELWVTKRTRHLSTAHR